MTDVGIRELKAKLSEYVNRAASGEAIVVTDRGRPIVRLVALSDSSNIDRGIQEGWVEPPRRLRLEPVTRIRAKRPVLDVLDEDRG